MATVKLAVRRRTDTGKQGSKRTRALGEVPAVLYGEKQDSVPISIDLNDLRTLLSTPSGRNVIIHLGIDGGEASGRAVIRDMVRDPVSREILHIDLQRISENKPVIMRVPVSLVGESLAVKEGRGILDHTMRLLEVRCLPRDIPEHIAVDISELEVKHAIHVSDISVEKVEILDHADRPVVEVLLPTLFVEPTEEGAEAAEEVEGEEGAEVAEGGSRHNVGFLVVAGLADGCGIRLSAGRGDFMSGVGRIAGTHVRFVMPLTYMNGSGRAVEQVLEEMGATPDEVLVICDDVNLPLGQLRFRRSGSAGGHKGLSSVIERLSTEGFARLRLGVGRPPDGDEMVDFVLDRFADVEHPDVNEMVIRAVAAVELMIRDGIGAAMTVFNRRKDPADGEGPQED